MDNYSRMLEIQEEAYDSAGTTQEQYAKFQESIEGKLGELTATLQDFYDALIEEGQLIRAIELFIQLAESISWATEKAGGLEGILTRLGKTLLHLRPAQSVVVDGYIALAKELQIVQDILSGDKSIIEAIDSLEKSFYDLYPVLDLNRKSFKEIREETTAMYETYARARSAMAEMYREYYNFRKDEAMPVKEWEVFNYTVEDTVNSMATLNSIYSDLNEQNGLSISQIMELVSLYPDYASQILLVNDSKESGKKLTELLFEVEKKRAIAVLEQEKEIAKAKLEELRLTQDILAATDPYALSELSKAYTDVRTIEKSIERIEGLTIDAFSNKIPKAVDEAKESIKDFSDQIHDENKQAVEDYNDAVIEGLEKHIELMEEARDIGVESREQEIADLKERKDLEDELNAIKEKQIELTKAEQALKNVQGERNVRLLTENGWEWVADPSAVADAQAEVAKLTADLEEMEAQRLYNAKITMLEKEKDKFEEAENAKISIVEGVIEQIENMEYNGYLDRLSQLQSFVNQYKSIYSQIGGISSPTIGTVGSSPSTSNSSKLQEMQLNALKWHNEPENRAELEARNEQLGSELGLTKSGGSWFTSGGQSAFDISKIIGSGNNMPSQTNKSTISSSSNNYNVTINAPNGATFDSMIAEVDAYANMGPTRRG